MIGSQVGQGLVGRGLSVGAGFLGGPLAAQGVNRLATNAIDRGNPFAFRSTVPGVDNNVPTNFMPTVGTTIPGIPQFDINRARNPGGGMGATQQNLGLGFQQPGMGYQSPNQLGQSSFDGAGNTINDRMNQWGQAPGSGPSRRGSSSLAEGQAAQDFVGNMQLGSWLGMRAPTGPGAPVNRMR